MIRRRIVGFEPVGRDLPRLGLAGRVLLLCSKAPEQARQRQATGRRETPLSLLKHVYPRLEEDLRGRRVLDYGCGDGSDVVALGRAGVAQAVGLDIQENLLTCGRRAAMEMGVEAVTRFCRSLDSSDVGSFDWIISKNSMEHFDDPKRVLQEMALYLKPEGRILVTFCPTWYSPYGAHMHFFTKVPWVHLIFPERVIMDVRARFIDDGARRFEDVTGGLNRMSVGRFGRIVREAGLKVELESNEYVKDLRALAALPGLTELFTNRVTQLLTRPAGGAEPTIGRP